MKNLSNIQHPCGLIPLLRDLAGAPFEFEFSQYVYRPRSTKDERVLVRCESETVEARIDGLIQGLQPEQELALHSKLYFADGRALYFPMLDLIGPFSTEMRGPIEGLMREFSVPRFAIYNSGRSAHVYGLHLFAQEELLKFFGHALLLNLPDQEAIVDSRWIGHRIYAGYGSLRWSCNTPQYLAYPEQIGIFSAL